MRGVLPLIVLLIASISCASIAGAPTPRSGAQAATTPPTATPTSDLPPAVQTADALNGAIATFVASIPTANPATQTAEAASATKAAAAIPVSGGQATAAPTPTAAQSAFTPTLPPAVQTADALNAAIATYIASIPTSAPSQTGTPVPALETLQAQFAAMSTLSASIGIAPPAKPSASATPTPLQAGGGISGGIGSSGGGTGNGGGGSGGGSGGSGGGSGGAGNGGGAGSSGGGGGGTGAYVVKQTETLGGERISGVVCSVTAPFSVNSATPKVAFVFVFVPKDATHGNVSYAYSIRSAGETHSATGTYTLTPAGKDGTLTLSLAVSDHVTFKGFDGNIPNRYKFDLVPSGTPCP